MILVLITYILVMKEENPERSSHSFPWAGARQGVIGDGQVGVTSYVVPKGAMAFWEKRLEKFNVPFTKMERFGEEYLDI